MKRGCSHCQILTGRCLFLLGNGARLRKLNLQRIPACLKVKSQDLKPA